ncbi:hypothetical protein OLX02_12250 [Novosphingobium sp. KCTC 2891]|uniref:hypothetical protein n=1 Tax=Novosphingobium sp. KCTC 2891 TaxID=2989730 RepID=UPI0022230D53|nr:hypothetical protein [Novosphingobium sp. KCTC 2891]MCW1383591.1 hypothetical protein [Novosphingobium sp. KCTC 2891]
MKPDISLAVAELANRLRTDLLAELTGFRANVAAMGAAMLDMVADEWDGATARLVRENRAFRALLDQGAAIYGSPAPGGDDEDLRVSALSCENDRLRGLITDLMARLEDDESAPAQTLLDAIWAELARTVSERRIASANF